MELNEDTRGLDQTPAKNNSPIGEKNQGIKDTGFLGKSSRKAAVLKLKASLKLKSGQ